MISKIKTIWKYGIVFGEYKGDVDNFRVDGDILYKGRLEKMKDQIAQEVVEIHPNFEEYYAAAMMPLYKTYGKNKKGTESAIWAIETLKRGWENRVVMPYILIWKII
jgi:hypothetical protein